jgi:hypothetical protein
MDAQLIKVCRVYAETNNVEMLKEYYEYMLSAVQTGEIEHTPDWPHIFQKVYLHACLKGSQEIANWMQQSVFPMLDPIQQIGLRQIFPYGRYLLGRAKHMRETRPPS